MELDEMLGISAGGGQEVFGEFWLLAWQEGTCQTLLLLCLPPAFCWV